MITQKELDISNESYIRKDFATIYPELVELCQKITERWNPTTSNESDPGIVLMKLAAFAADKNNYNIDKNILESFMPSATQESSMRMLCEMNGYNMKYYRSATTPISFMYNGDLSTEEGNSLSFSLKRYTTAVKTEDDSLTYTLIADCPIAYAGVTSTALAIEGSINLLTVGDESVIRLVNMDENNRVYLPERMVAENGIFIHDVDSNNAWSQVNNLNTQILGSKVFKFGYDSQRELPYIEFPADIASLIGNGLYIYYTITSGVQGNTAAGTITALSAPDQVEADQLDADFNPIVISDLSDNLKINNAAAASTGSDPESIDEAYSNFKRTIGTFDTLVTCRDYANFIYNIVDDSTLNYLVSNVQAADRRKDYNYSNNIITFTPDEGSFLSSFVSEANITPYELCLYPLKPITASYTQATYDTSFQPLNLSEVIENKDLENAKCMSHDYKELSASDIYCFKNKYNLDIRISTYEKLNNYQQSILLGNVKTALYRNFNARAIEYGEPIPRDTLKSVIRSADSRISDVDFENWGLTTYFMTKDGNEVEITDQSSASVLQDLIAKNILAGTISLFEYTDSYDLEFGQGYANYTPHVPQYKIGDGAWQDYPYSGYPHINYVDTEVRIPYGRILSPETEDWECLAPSADPENSGYRLQANETLQFIEPNLQSALQYGTYVNYRVEGLTDPIAANTSHRLTGSERLSVVYTDADTGLEKSVVYTASSIIENGVETQVNAINIFKANFDLVNTSDSVSSASIIKGGVKYLILGSNQTIDKQVYVRTVLDDAILRCYWLVNNPTNTLFTATGDLEYILGEGEYFIYSNSNLTELTVLGSGTRLTLAEAPTADWTIADESLITIENISDKGLGAFSEVNWQSKYLSNNSLTIEEMTLTSFAEGDRVTISDWDSSSEYVGNDWIALPNTAVVTAVRADGSKVTLDVLPSMEASTARLVRSYLNLNCGPNRPQLLRFNHFVQLKYIPADQTEEPIYYQLNDRQADWKDKDAYHTAYFKSGYLLQELGGTDLAIASVSNLLYSLELTEGVHFILYQSGTVSLAGQALERNGNGLFAFPLNQFNGTDVPLSILPLEEEDEYILMYYDKFTTNITLTIRADARGIALFNHQDTGGSSVTLMPGINIVKLPRAAGIKELRLSHTGTLSDTESDTLYVGAISLASGYNASFGNMDMTGVLARLVSAATVDGVDKFNYLYQPSNEETMDTSNLLAPEALWDKNNIANMFTLAQIDFDNSSISLTNASKL